MATISTTFNPANTQRLATALGRRLNLRNPDGTRRSATIEEATEYQRNQWILMAREEERAAAREAAEASVTDITAT